jgi:hypothetical protein
VEIRIIMKNKIFGLLLLIAFVFGCNSAWAQEVTIPETDTATPLVTLTENSTEDNDPITLSNIGITLPANKLTYTIGEGLDISGLVVTGMYSDGSEKIEAITEESITGFNSTAPATGQILTITVGDQTATYTVDITEATTPPEGDTTEDTNISENIILKNGCEITDTEGAVHVFPETGTGNEYLAVCAIVAAQEAGHISGFELTDSEYGLYVKSVHGIQPSDTEYWALWHNGAFANCGIGCLALEEGDVLQFILTDWMTEEEKSRIELAVINLEELPIEIDLPDACAVTDTDGTIHNFPKEDSVSSFLAICAIASAQEAGHINDFEVANNADFGLYVTSVDGISPNESEYWALWLNEGFAECGIGCLPLTQGDMLSLVLTNWATETEGTTLSLRIRSLVTSSGEETPSEDNPGGGGGNDNPNSDGTGTAEFNTGDALSYLKGVQAGDGSFENSEFYTDWAAIAYGAGNVTGSAKSSLLDYMRSHNSLSSLLTDNERRAMAILALGEDPYDFEGVNYIEAIIQEFDGEQFGDDDIVNDDMFALIPLANAGYDEDDEVVTETISFILSQQRSNGSWEGSVDVTAAAIQALKEFDSVDGVDEALENAANYIQNSQRSDGGWGNISSTSWAMQAESALNASWEKEGKNGLDYLAQKQENAKNNGAVLPVSETAENTIWNTSYAIPAGLGKTWSEIMDSVSRPRENNEEDNSSIDEDKESLEETESDAENTEPEENTGEVLGMETEPSSATLPPLPTFTKITKMEPEAPAPINEEEAETNISASSLTASIIDTPTQDQNDTSSIPLFLTVGSGSILLFALLRKFLF